MKQTGHKRAKGADRVSMRGLEPVVNMVEVSRLFEAMQRDDDDKQRLVELLDQAHRILLQVRHEVLNAR